MGVIVLRHATIHVRQRHLGDHLLWRGSHGLEIGQPDLGVVVHTIKCELDLTMAAAAEVHIGLLIDLAGGEVQLELSGKAKTEVNAQDSDTATSAAGPTSHRWMLSSDTKRSTLRQRGTICR